MALPTILVNDFVGWLKIVANSFKQDGLELYISQFQEEYLRDIVGAAVYQDIENQTRQKWRDLLDGVLYVDEDDKRQYFPGLTDPLKKFIYFEFVRDNWTPTQTGKHKGKSENSNQATDLTVLNVARSRYNHGVRQVNELTEFLKANDKFEEEVTTSVDNVDNTYTLSIASTKYLEDTDIVEITGTDYAVSNVVADVSIDINAGQTGLDFTGEVVIWKPYEEIEFCELGFCGI